MNTEELKILMEIKQEQGRQSATLEQILEQAKKTNSRVSKLEDRVDDLEKAGDLSAGAKSVREKAWGKVWEVTKMVISAGIGAAVATMKGGKG